MFYFYTLGIQCFSSCFCRCNKAPTFVHQWDPAKSLGVAVTPWSFHSRWVGWVWGVCYIYIYATVTVASYDTIQGLYGIVTFFIRICSNQPVCTTLGDFMEQFAALFQMVTSLSGELTSTSSLYGKWIWIELSSFVFNMFSWLWRSVNVWHIWGLVKARETAMELRRKFNFPCHVVQAFGIVKCRSWGFFFTF